MMGIIIVPEVMLLNGSVLIFLLDWIINKSVERKKPVWEKVIKSCTPFL